MHMDENSGTYLSNIQHFTLPQHSRLLTFQNFSSLHVYSIFAKLFPVLFHLFQSMY